MTQRLSLCRVCLELLELKAQEGTGSRKCLPQRMAWFLGRGDRICPKPSPKPLEQAGSCYRGRTPLQPRGLGKCALCTTPLPRLLALWTNPCGPAHHQVICSKNLTSQLSSAIQGLDDPLTHSPPLWVFSFSWAHRS